MPLWSRSVDIPTLAWHPILVSSYTCRLQVSWLGCGCWVTTGGSSKKFGPPWLRISWSSTRGHVGPTPPWDFSWTHGVADRSSATLLSTSSTLPAIWSVNSPWAGLGPSNNVHTLLQPDSNWLTGEPLKTCTLKVNLRQCWLPTTTMTIYGTIIWQ